MSTIDRTVQPALKEIEEVKIIPPRLIHLDNRIPVYSLDISHEDLMKLEFIFPAGRWFERKKTVALATNKLLKEGTESHTAKEIADRIEFYGATLQVESGTDVASVTLFCLNKHLENLLPLVKEILTTAVFPEKELKIFIKNSKQHLMVEKEKVEFIANKKFHEALYGEGHPYGYSSVSGDYDNLNRQDLLKFYKTNYVANHCKIIMAGKVSEASLKSVNKYFGTRDWNGKSEDGKRKLKDFISKKQKFHLKKRDAVQSAIRIGKTLFNKTHPDYLGMSVLNTVLGGYFGSRLMANIREDKGFTYGIYSRLNSLLYGGYFYISTEVGREVTEKAVNEIYSEIQRLKTESVPADELQLVKNYMLGTLLSRIDGPFNLSETIKGLILYNLDTSYFDRWVNTIKTVSADELLRLANQYLDEKSMYEIIAGAN